ncbi:MAG TPA: PH domain-containing protein [Actinomycetales bacterium]|nr:PH domain-containing protein [Actinomycetales bacterium]
MEQPEPRAASWSPGVLWPSVQIALGIVVVVVGLLSDSPIGLLLSGLAALFLLPAGALQLVRRPRLEVVDGELAIKTLTGTRFVPRSEVVEVRDLGIPRWGIRQHLMRIEYTDEQGREQLDVFTRADLGTDPRDVVDRLVELGFPGRRVSG